jgi:hypothetical protein
MGVHCVIHLLRRMFIYCCQSKCLAVSLYVFMISTGGIVTLEPVAVSRLLVLGTEGHFVDSHGLLVLCLHWRQTVMKRVKQLIKWNWNT